MPEKGHSLRRVSAAIENRNRRMLRARDAMDRDFARPLDVAAVAAVAHVSQAHFSRQFRATFAVAVPGAVRCRRSGVANPRVLGDDLAAAGRLK